VQQAPCATFQGLAAKTKHLAQAPHQHKAY